MKLFVNITLDRWCLRMDAMIASAKSERFSAVCWDAKTRLINKKQQQLAFYK